MPAGGSNGAAARSRPGSGVGDVERAGVGANDGVVVLDVPAHPRSLRLLRLAAADAAATLEFDLDRIETARLVVDELASVVIGALQGVPYARLRVSVVRGERVVELQGVAEAPNHGTVEPDFIVRELLDASIGSDSWSFDARSDLLSFRASVPARRG